MVIPIVIGALGILPKELIKGQEHFKIRGQVENITKIGHNTEKSAGGH